MGGGPLKAEGEGSQWRTPRGPGARGRARLPAPTVVSVTCLPACRVHPPVLGQLPFQADPLSVNVPPLYCFTVPLHPLTR